MKTFTESPPLTLPPTLAAATIPGSDTSLLITIGAIAGVAGSALGTAAAVGLAVVPVLQKKFPKQMQETQLDDYAEKLFGLIASVNPLLQQLSAEHQDKIKTELKDPRQAKDLILSKPEDVVKKLVEQGV